MEHIFDLWPSISALADDLGKPYPTVAAWKHRRSIPGEYDTRLMAAAKARGIELSFEQIAIARAGQFAPDPEADAVQREVGEV